MNYTKIKKSIQKRIKKELPLGRYAHIIRVAKLAKKLAVQYGLNEENAELAALTHDLARLWSKEKLMEYVQKKHIELSEEELASPFMLHGLAAALILRTQYDYHNEDVFNAIRFHTTGRKGMSDLEKLIYLADTVEPGRKHVSTKIKNELKNESLNEMLYRTVKRGIKYQKQKNKKCHPWTMDMYEELKEIRKHEE